VVKIPEKLTRQLISDMLPLLHHFSNLFSRNSTPANNKKKENKEQTNRIKLFKIQLRRLMHRQIAPNDNRLLPQLAVKQSKIFFNDK
jgi:hypothetical protein